MRIVNVETFEVVVPMAFDDIDGMYEVRRSIDTPIVADESCFTIDDAMQLVGRRAAFVLQDRREHKSQIG